MIKLSVPVDLLSSMYRNWFERPCLELTAKPGLITLIDLALLRSIEGELTASICAAHALLAAWIDLKSQAQLELQTDGSTTFARHCLEAACDAMEKLSTDHFAASANLSDAFETSERFSTTTLMVGEVDIKSSLFDTGRRAPQKQRPRDCWETARLICPDQIWAEDVYVTELRLLKTLTKQLPPVDSQLVSLIQNELPMRLHHFRCATEANAVVLKRLFLVKTEYRAPFRAFLEAHQTLQRAPSLDLVNRYLQSPKAAKKGEITSLEELLKTPELVEALQIEQLAEQLEKEMANKIFCFTEFARLIENKGARINRKVVPEDQVQPLMDILRRLKGILCKKMGPDTSAGLRPLLMDLQGIPRDEESLLSRSSKEETVDDHIKHFLKHLNKLATLCETKHAFVTDRKGENVDPSSAIIKACRRFDTGLWEAQCQDWFALVKRQEELRRDFDKLSEQIRKAEIEVSIRVADKASLKLVKERLERYSTDREKKFEVLKEMIEEVCLREMNWNIVLMAPKTESVLELASTSVVGLLGEALNAGGEPLPIG